MLRARLQMVGQAEVRVIPWCSVIGCHGLGWLQYHVVTYDFTPLLRDLTSERPAHVWLCQKHMDVHRQVWAERRGGATVVRTRDTPGPLPQVAANARVYHP